MSWHAVPPAVPPSPLAEARTSLPGEIRVRLREGPSAKALSASAHGERTRRFVGRSAGWEDSWQPETTLVDWGGVVAGTDTDGTTTRYRDLWAPPTDSCGPRRHCVPDMGRRFGACDDEPDVRLGGLPTRRHDPGGAGVAGPGRVERTRMPDRHGILALVEGQCQSRPQRGRLPGCRTPVPEAAHVEALASVGVGVGPIWLHHVPPFGVVCRWRPGLAHQLHVIPLMRARQV